MKIFIEEKAKGDCDAVIILTNKEAKALANLVDEAQKKQPDLRKLKRLAKPLHEPIQENLAVF